MSGRVVKRAYKYRFYPTPQQAELLNRTFGSVRYVYNRALAERSRPWTQEQKRVTFSDTCRMLTAWKNPGHAVDRGEGHQPPARAPRPGPAGAGPAAHGQETERLREPGQGPGEGGPGARPDHFSA